MLRNIIGKIFGFSSDINHLENTIKILENEISEMDKLIDNLNKDIKTLKIELKEKETRLEEYLNNKRPKINKLYIRHETDDTYYIDIRDFYQIYDSNLPKVSGTTYDEIAYNCLMWVQDNIKYISDKKEYGYNEYWAYSYQTLKNRVGDCDDGSILLANMLLANGIPYYRVRLNAGTVKGGGHCYVSYCREYDNQFVVLDWCFYPNKLEIRNRKKHSEERNYINKERNYMVWFSWNLKYIFGTVKDPKKLDDKYSIEVSK